MISRRPAQGPRAARKACRQGLPVSPALA